MDQISDFLSDLPIGFIIFAIAMLFGLFGRDDKKQQQQAPSQRRTQQAAAPSEPSTFASDDRRAREEAERREREREEVIVFGGLDFGSRGSMFADDGNDRDSQWGKTKFGFDESEWGSDAQWGWSFGEKKNSDPVIR